MQWLGVFIISLLGYSIKELAIRAVTAVGFGLVTTYGIFQVIDALKSSFQAQLIGLPSDLLAMLGLMQIDVAFVYILSAITTKQVLLGWKKLTDSRTGRVWKTPGSGSGGTLGA